MITKKYGMLEQALAWLRFNGKCLLGCEVSEHYLELEHWTAKSNGGLDKDFALLCSRCNKRKDNKDGPEVFSGEIVAKYNAAIKLQFSESELLEEVSRLVFVELEYIRRMQKLGAKFDVSLGTKRAMVRKDLRAQFASLLQESKVNWDSLQVN